MARHRIRCHRSRRRSARSVDHQGLSTSYVAMLQPAMRAGGIAAVCALAPNAGARLKTRGEVALEGETGAVQLEIALHQGQPEAVTVKRASEPAILLHEWLAKPRQEGDVDA